MRRAMRPQEFTTTMLASRVLCYCAAAGSLGAALAN